LDVQQYFPRAYRRLDRRLCVVHSKPHLCHRGLLLIEHNANPLFLAP
jgi:hypothetical protein